MAACASSSTRKVRRSATRGSASGFRRPTTGAWAGEPALAAHASMNAATGLDVVSLYRQQVAGRGFVSDAAQWRAVERLQRLYEEWRAYKARRATALRRLLVKPALP